MYIKLDAKDENVEESSAIIRFYVTLSFNFVLFLLLNIYIIHIHVLYLMNSKPYVIYISVDNNGES